MPKFGLILGFFTIIAFDAFNFGHADPLTTEQIQNNIETLFKEFGTIIGPDAATNTQGYLAALQAKSFTKLHLLTSYVEADFKQYEKYFKNNGYYKSLKQKSDDLKTALDTYLGTFPEGTADDAIPLSGLITTLKTNMGV